MYYIGGLIVAHKPCNCNAPFIETFERGDGQWGVIVWAKGDDNPEGTLHTLYDPMPDEMDNLAMVCSRCGRDVISAGNI